MWLLTKKFWVGQNIGTIARSTTADQSKAKVMVVAYILMQVMLQRALVSHLTTSDGIFN